MVDMNQLALLKQKNKELKEELEVAANYIQENEVVHKKHKNNVPTVIEYQGRRYILDHTYKG